MKRAIIVHCWGGKPEYCWYPAVKKELASHGFEVLVPAFPDTDMPSMVTWVPHLAEVIGKPDKDLILIGHSIGCPTILRYLETLSEGAQIGGVILVAGFSEDIGYSEIANYFATPIDFKKVKQHTDRFIAIYSDNDPYVDVRFADIFKKELHAEVIIKHKAGHFSAEDNCVTLPDVVDGVLKINN